MLSNLWDNFKHSNNQIIGVPEREEEEQEIENLFEKIMKENFPNFGEGNRHISPGSMELPKQDGHKEDNTKAHHN